MPVRIIRAIVLHCSASANGVSLARVGTPGNGAKSAALVIDGWHGQPLKDKLGNVVREHNFQRNVSWRSRFNPQFGYIGYHSVIDIDGTTESGRHVDEQGAHVAGHNLNTLGLCCVGTDKFTLAQWQALRLKVQALLKDYPNARVCGHRDLSPDRNGDGRIDSSEWLKICPGFDATDWWLNKGMQPMVGHIVDASQR